MIAMDGNIIDSDLVRREQGPPYALFADWREKDPVHWNPVPDTYDNPNAAYKMEHGIWVLTRYRDVDYASRNPLLFSSAIGGPQIWDFPPVELERTRSGMMGMDPPRHTQFKRLVLPPFQPKSLRAFEAEIERMAIKIVDSVADRGECEFVFDVASRLPVYTFCVLMGIPEHDHEYVFRIGNALADMERGQDIPALQQELAAYSLRLAAEKEQNPDSSMLSAYVNGRVDGERLTPAEIAMFFGTIAVAGHETTRNTAVHFIRLMNQFSEQYALLRSNPDQYLPGAIDEVLRFSPPVLGFRRTASQDVQIGDTHIKAGEKVYLAYGAANRDPAMFADPDRFDVTRANAGRHLSFGIGQHVCLGARLANMQLKLLLNQIVRRIPDIRPVGSELDYLPSLLFNAVRSFPVVFTPERQAA